MCADYMMPGMSGVTFCTKLREVVPRSVSSLVPHSWLCMASGTSFAFFAPGDFAVLALDFVAAVAC